MRPQTHIRLTYITGKQMGLDDITLNKLITDILKPDFLDLPFIIPKHYYGAGRDVRYQIKHTNNLAFKLHHFEDTGNPYHTTWLYIGRHFNYEVIIDKNWDVWNLTEDVLNAPVEDDCLGKNSGIYCEQVAIYKLAKESKALFNRLDNAMIYENNYELKDITKHIISRTSSYVKGVIRNYGQ